MNVQNFKFFVLLCMLFGNGGKIQSIIKVQNFFYSLYFEKHLFTNFRSFMCKLSGKSTYNMAGNWKKCYFRNQNQQKTQVPNQITKIATGIRRI